MSTTGDNDETQLGVARNFRRGGHFVQACGCYLSMMETSPSLQQQERLTDEMLECFKAACDRLTSVVDISKIYTQAQLVLPRCVVIHNCMGATYFRLGEVDKARTCYNKVLELNTHSPAAIENVDNINCQLVDRWHYLMLNDSRRNTAFELAIQRAVTSERTSILDIGSGTCLLSMMAVRAGFTAVYACDDSSAMCNVSQDILQSNGVDNKVKLLFKHSTEISAASHHCKGDDLVRLNAIVTETVDCGLFGEHILSTVSHAWRNLLRNENNSVIIPGGARLFCCVIEASDITLHHRCFQPALKAVNLDGMAFVDGTSQPVADLPLADMFDPYTTYNLKTVRGGYKRLSEKKMCMEVNFNSLQCVEHLLAGHQQVLDVRAVKDGNMHAIAVWFDLHLDDKVTISTDPEGEPSCWGAAIFPLSNLSSNDSHITERDTLTLRAATANDYLRLTLEGVSRDDASNGQPTTPVVEESADCSRTRAEYCCECGYTSPNSSPVTSIVLSDAKFYLDTQEVYRLNDSVYNSQMISAIEKLKVSRTNATFSVLDTSPMFSTLPLQACGLGADVAYWLAADDYRESLYTILCHKNDINNAVNVPDVDSMKDIGLDCVLCDLIEPSGVMRQRVLNDLAYLKLTSLRRNSGVILPGKVDIWGQCIHSPQLLEYNQVLGDSSTCGYNIASHFNKLRVRTERDIDITTLTYCTCSEPVHLLTLYLNSLEVCDQGLPKFLNQEKRRDVELTCGKTHDVTAIIYWFELALDDNLVISTRDADSHWRQAATVISLADPSAAKVSSVITRIEDGVLGISAFA